MELSGQIVLVAKSHLLLVNWSGTKGKPGSLADVLRWADEQGMEPYFDAKANRNADVVVGAVADALDHGRPINEQSQWFPDQGGAPVCPVHRKPMSESKFGGWFCPRKDGDQYCKVKVDENGRWRGVR